MASTGAIKQEKKEIKENLIYTYLYERIEEFDISLVAHDLFLKDKKIDYTIYSLICLKAHYMEDEEGNKGNYILDEDVEPELIAEIVGLSVQTVKKKIKYMIEIGLLKMFDDGRGLAYLIVKNVDGKYFALIPKSVLIGLVAEAVINNNYKEFIKTYVYLLCVCYRKPNDLSRSVILEALGLPNNNKQAVKITKYTTKLQNLGLISKKRINKKRLNNGAIEYYSINRYKLVA